MPKNTNDLNSEYMLAKRKQLLNSLSKTHTIDLLNMLKENRNGLTEKQINRKFLDLDGRQVHPYKVEYILRLLRELGLITMRYEENYIIVSQITATTRYYYLESFGEQILDTINDKITHKLAVCLRKKLTREYDLVENLFVIETEKTKIDVELNKLEKSQNQ